MVKRVPRVYAQVTTSGVGVERWGRATTGAVVGIMRQVFHAGGWRTEMFIGSSCRKRMLRFDIFLFVPACPLERERGRAECLVAKMHSLVPVRAKESSD